MRYNVENIYALLTEGFTDEELRCLCYDTPDFHHVYNQLGPHTASQGQVIQLLIEHANRKLQVETLLALAKEHNPDQYEKHQPYVDVMANSPTSRVGPEKPRRTGTLPESTENLPSSNQLALPPHHPISNTSQGKYQRTPDPVDKGGTMAKALILFADNDPDFLNTRAEFLQQWGYQVITATNPREAREIFQQRPLNLAILDLRLRDDQDDRDLSGLDLAREVAQSVPKIILTGFPTYEYVREALKPALEGLPVAVDFIAKKDGHEALLQAVQAALSSREVFVVHGHDEAVKESVARFIEKLDLQAIILHEQPNAGRTIIEKIEAYANVDFVVVLLTPDDMGASQNQPQELRPRARQNVIFELGYFIGKFGRSKVCALYKEKVELPSDYQGVLYLPLDPGGSWRLALAKEIKGIGIDIDLNRAL